MSLLSHHRVAKLRHRLYEILEQGPVGDRTGRLVSRFIVALIVVNLIAVALESVPDLEARFGLIFSGIEIASLLIFSVEYGLRLWIAVEHPPDHHLGHRKARLKFATSALGIIDLIAVLPFWFTLTKSPSSLRRTPPRAVANMTLSVVQLASSSGIGMKFVIVSPSVSGSKFTNALPRACGAPSGRRHTLSL